MTIRSVGAELFNVDRRTDGQADMTKLTVAFFCAILRTRLIKTNEQSLCVVPLLIPT